LAHGPFLNINAHWVVHDYGGTVDGCATWSL
jgi:hypothetical protein